MVQDMTWRMVCNVPSFVQAGRWANLLFQVVHFANDASLDLGAECDALFSESILCMQGIAC